MRRTMVAGNWKMNGNQVSVAGLLDGVVEGLGKSGDIDVVICPPFVYLPMVAEKLSSHEMLAWGGQNLDTHASGAYTGEIAGPMLRDFGCRFVIVGHSERRSHYGESDLIVAEKAAAALECGLTPIVCMGETLEEREADQTEEVVGRQLDAVLTCLGSEALEQIVIAYEPVWAIGTGLTATPEQAQAVHAFIRQCLSASHARTAEGMQILYGGSVKPGNASALFSQPDIDGGLIGGAALDADDFLGICKAG